MKLITADAVERLAAMAIAFGVLFFLTNGDAKADAITAMQQSTPVVERPADCVDKVEITNCRTGHTTKWCQTPDGGLYKTFDGAMPSRDFVTFCRPKGA